MKTTIIKIAVLFFMFISLNKVNSASPNLIVNGDFSGGNSGFTSDYSFCNTANCGYTCHCGDGYIEVKKMQYVHQ